jgi:hypothetical protein
VTRSALLIGGTGPTGPLIARGLEARGFTVTLLHSGRHEVDDVAHFRQLHGDVFSDDGVCARVHAIPPGDARARTRPAT